MYAVASHGFVVSNKNCDFCSIAEYSRLLPVAKFIPQNKLPTGLCFGEQGDVVGVNNWC